MADLFSTAQVFLPKQEVNPERMLLIREVKTIIQKSELLSDGEKQKVGKVIPMFSNAVIKDLQQTLIRQNLRHLKRKMATI